MIWVTQRKLVALAESHTKVTTIGYIEFSKVESMTTALNHSRSPPSEQTVTGAFLLATIHGVPCHRSSNRFTVPTTPPLHRRAVVRTLHRRTPPTSITLIPSVPSPISGIGLSQSGNTLKVPVNEHHSTGASLPAQIVVMRQDKNPPKE